MQLNCALHSAIDFPPILTVEITLAGFLLLMVATVITAYRRGPRVLANLILAFLFAYGIEAGATCSGAYSYYFAYYYLPGWVPLYVVCGWAMVFFAAFTTSQRLFEDWKVIAVATGLFAVSLDLMLDPGASGLDLWVWTTEHRLWYQVPWSNFFGWSLLMCMLAAATLILERQFAGRPESIINLVIEKTLAFALGYLAFGLVFFIYSKINTLLSTNDIPLLQTLLHVLIFGGAFYYVLSHFPAKRGTLPIDWMVLAIPIYLIGCAMAYAINLTLFEQPGRPSYHTLLFMIPFVAALVMKSVYWPYQDANQK